MREDTSIICPLSGSHLIHTGATSDGFVHFYESSTNQGIRYRRYRLDWTVLELRGGDNRFFHINGSETVEVKKYGDKWLSLTATDNDKQQALAEHSKRTQEAFMNMKFPTIKNVQTKLLAHDIQPHIPLLKPSGKTFMLKYINMNEKTRVIDNNARPNVSVDDCPLVEYITGKVGVVTKNELAQLRTDYKEPDIQVGDTIYEWDMGGWEAMAGRSGEAIFRNNEYITSKLLKMS